MGMSWRRAIARGIALMVAWWMVMGLTAQIVQGPGARQALLILALLGIPAGAFTALLLTRPPMTEEERERLRQQAEYDAWVASWTPPPVHVIHHVEGDPHQEHLADQARMFALFGREVPPTDYFPR